MRAQRPGHDVDVVLLDQRLEPGDLSLAPCAVIAIEEAADHVVRLARAAVPGAEADAAQAVFGGQIGIRHAAAAR